MKFLTLLGVMAGICLWANAQQQNIKPLTVGDSVPDITFTNLINYPTQTVKLSDFKGKLVILDFWATWCGSCIAKFLEMHLLQQEFNGDLQIILVNSNSTGDTKTSISRFLSKRAELLKPVSLPIVPEEVIVNDLFPHNALPHYVWIKDQKVIAISGAEEITSSNIKAAINDNLPDLRRKVDVDHSKLLYLENAAPLQNLIRYSIVFKGQLFNLISGGRIFSLRTSGEKIKGILLGNYALYDIYQKVASILLEGYEYDNTRIIVKTSDTAGLYFTNRDKDMRKEWQKTNLYTLDLFAPSDNLSELYKTVLEEVNKNTPYNGKIEELDTKCYVLTIADPKKAIGYLAESKSHQDKLISIGNTKTLKALIQSAHTERFPFIDSTGLNPSEKLNVYLPDNTKNLDRLKQALLKNNLQLTEKILKIQMFVIDKPNN